MATTAELQQKLTAKLRELFQLDQPDLDFGFYRVMHAKQKEISDFLDTRLPQTLAAAFKDSGSTAVAALEAAYHAAVAQAQSFGAPDPEATEPVKAAKKAWEDAKGSGDAETDVYDHLYHFFERYYDHGDFVSLRYLTRETDKHAKPYAIPYAGEEVMLHWANADQYYIKTSENFSHFSVDVTQHPVFRKMDAMEKMTLGFPDKPLKLHFNIVDADEGEHGNVKEGKDRFFILHDEEPCAMKEDGLHVNFEYRADENMQGKAAKWQEELRKKAQQDIRAEISEDVAQMAMLVANAGYPPEYAKLLFYEYEVGEKREKQTILGSYLKRYMARNTADYFIHKDLGGFLRRELDFYIKNELMILDDVTAATPETVAKWLGKTKVFRTVALDIIAFLAQLEDFQKKLWLKKKFVVQCDYCITMDRVPDELKPEVLANEKQLAAWKERGTDADPRATDLTAIDARMVDTQFFPESFKQKLLASIDDFDAQCDGVLIHSDNFQGANFLINRCRSEVKCVYLDPPYNTSEVGFIYKNNYRHSSWASMINDRVRMIYEMLRQDGAVLITIDDEEVYNLKKNLDALLGDDHYVGTVVIESNPRGRGINSFYATCHEYCLSYAKDPTALTIVDRQLTEEQVQQYKSSGEEVAFRLLPFRRSGGWSTPADRPNSEFPLFFDKSGRLIAVGGDRKKPMPHAYEAVDVLMLDSEGKTIHLDENTFLEANPGALRIMPVDTTGARRVWRWSDRAKILTAGSQGDFVLKDDHGRKYVQLKDRIKDGRKPKTIWCDPKFDSSSHGTNLLRDILGQRNVFGFPKSVYSTQESLHSIVGEDESGDVLDLFGGSGTTAHSVINLNREDKDHKKRRYTLIEMGDHFDTVLKPRIEKVVYSPDWKDGAAVSSNRGISHCFKYLRLESYEDALNNLVVDGEKGKDFAEVKDYFLKYMLDVETKGSPSLLRMGEVANPFGMTLTVKKPASEEREERVVDLVETFNYLIGLRVKNVAAMRSYTAEFERVADPELPSDGHTKLTIKGAIKLDAEGAWKFRTVEGWIPKNRFTPNDGAKERVLIVWRTLTDDREKDNAVLDYYLQHKEGVNPLSGEYDVIYVNGSNNVPNLKQEGDTWKVRSIEEDFQTRMWEDC